jgi:hypothetical protein
MYVYTYVCWLQRGLSQQLARQVAEELTAKDVVRAHARDELGIDIDELANPLQVGGCVDVTVPLDGPSCRDGLGLCSVQSGSVVACWRQQSALLGGVHGYGVQYRPYSSFLGGSCIREGT